MTGEPTSSGESPILAALAALDGTGVLLVEAGRPVTVAEAIGFVDAMQTAMRDARLTSSSRMCVVMPGGRLLALTALALMSIGTFAPLNPRLTEAELDSLFSDLDADALVSLDGFAPAAHRAAHRRGMCVIEVAGNLRVIVSQRRSLAPIEHPAVHAVLLHTSGTTATPKLVGLTAANLTSTASAVSATLRLTREDRCLNVMPLFHIHGIVGVLLASVFAGASVELPGRFDPFSYRRRLANPHITWTSAVPSMYRAMLLGRSSQPAPVGLRLARSSSAPMPIGLVGELEDTLGCPVINAYGMTEASHQMTSNSLPPAERRVGTVGTSAGAEVAVLANGSVSTVEATLGEVVVRGPGVMHGYLSPASANADAWHEGWFRTGDLGWLGAQGHVTLHGRIKEIINVGGEKVSPYEVESALLEHPSIVDVVAFGVPDRLRGEQVCAGVVMRDGADPVSESALRRFVTERLAAFKTPRRIVVLDRIPLGPTGKVQRSRLASMAAFDDVNEP